MTGLEELLKKENQGLSEEILQQPEDEETKLIADGGSRSDTSEEGYSQGYLPPTEQQEKIVQRLNEIDSQFTASARNRRKKGLIMDLQIPLQGNTAGLIEELETEVSLVRWYDVESDERYKAHPEDIQYLHETGLSEQQLERLGYDTSELN